MNMYQNDMLLSLKSDTFSSLHSDFDEVLASTLRGMVETEQDTAEINVKVKISMQGDVAPDLSVIGEHRTREITKPKFEHIITAIIQRKEKKTGSLSGEYELVVDPETGCYVMRPIDIGQINFFDENGEVIDNETSNCAETACLVEGPRMLSDGVAQDNGRDEPEEDSEVIARFERLKQLIGQEMHVVEEVDDNYTLRTDDDQIVLSSLVPPANTFYCAGWVLENHVGHRIICVGDGRDDIERVSIECESCGEILYVIGKNDNQEIVVADLEKIFDEDDTESPEETTDAEDAYEYDEPEDEIED